jgi:MFS family permease
MSPPVALTTSPAAHGSLATTDDDSETQRRNWWIHVLEGSALIGAFGAINSNTVGTSLVEHLGGAAWMVAMMPMASTMGFAIGPILVAHHMDRQKQFLPVLKRMVPASRIPVLVTALTLWWFGSSQVALWTVLLGTVAYGILGGLTVGAWQQLVAKTVPPAKRSSMFAIRYGASNLLGLVSGALVTVVLARWPGTDGYALLHLIAFGGAVVSYRLLISVREPRGTTLPPLPEQGFWQNLRGVPALFRADSRLGAYLASAVLFNAQYLLMGFLALHARNVLGQGEAYVGTLTSAQMSGAVLGTVLAALFGDRHGSRRLLISSRLVLVLVAAAAAFAESDWAFRALFAAYGAAIWVNLAGHNTMTLQLMPAARRSTALAVFSLVQVPSMLIAAELGAWLWHAQASFAWIAGLSALGLFGALMTMLPVRLHARE